MEFGQNETELATLSAKADFRKLGPRLGKDMKRLAGEIQKLDAEACEDILGGGDVEIVLDGKPFEVRADELVVERTPREGLAVSAQSSLVVALEIELSDELVLEGLAREVVNRLQQIRKSMDLDVTQRIGVSWATKDVDLARAIDGFRGYVMSETLALEMDRGDPGLIDTQPLEINGKMVWIVVKPV